MGRAKTHPASINEHMNARELGMHVIGTVKLGFRIFHIQYLRSLSWKLVICEEN